MKYYYEHGDLKQIEHFEFDKPIFNRFTGKFFCEKCSKMGCPGDFGHYTFNLSLWIDKKKQKFKAWIRSLSDFDYSKIDDIEVDGIDTKDYPDFCDAYISSATYKGKEMTESQLEKLNENSSFVYECVIDQLY